MGKKFDITPEQEKFSLDMADFVVEGVKRSEKQVRQMYLLGYEDGKSGRKKQCFLEHQCIAGISGKCIECGK